MEIFMGPVSAVASIQLLSPTDGSVLASANVNVTLELKGTVIKKITAGNKKINCQMEKTEKKYKRL